VASPPNSSNPVSVTMNQARSITANYQLQYQLTLATNTVNVSTSHLTPTPAGATGGWYDAGTSVSVAADSPVAGGSPGSRYDFRNWTGDVASPPNSSNPVSVTMNQARSITANYRLQYQAHFTVTGLGAADVDATATVLMVGSTNYKVGDFAVDVWVDSGNNLTYTYAATVASTTLGKQYLKTSGPTPASPINNVTAPQSITAGYQAKATVALTVTPSTQQYSDTVNLSATITPATAGTVQFQKSTNGGTTYSNMGSPVTVSGGVAALNNQQINDAPATAVRFKGVFSPTDTVNYLPSSDDKPLTVTQEDAAATYTGPLFIFTPSVSTGVVSVPLRATIQDPTALLASDPRYDASAGDIRNASVKFVAREAGGGYTAGQTICTATLTLIDASDLKTATAACATTPTFNIGSADSESFEIGIVVGNYYLADSQADNTIITISKPYATQFITGGGYLLLNNQTAGTYKGDTGSKNNFGFNVKYNSKGTNLQGRVNTIIRRGGHLYQVKANNLLTLGVSYCKAGATPGTVTNCTATPTAPCTYNASSTCPIQATFTGSASIQDVTNPSAPISIEGGATVQLDMVDWGEPGSNGPAGPDQMGITVWTKTNVLWYSSRWNGTKTVMQLLDGGNLVVH
jgi:hypothetical protein